MLNYVKRSELEAEKERRIRAEAEADTSRKVVDDLQERLRQAIALNGQQGERHQQELSELLEHLAPIAPASPEGTSATPATSGAPKTLEELLFEAMNSPAAGPGGIHAKRNLIDAIKAMMKNNAATSNGNGETPDDELNDAERERVSKI